VIRHLQFDRLHNFRDVGGYPTADGRTVRWGTLYRSDSLSKLAGPDLARFRQLGIRTVIDLRYPWEIEARGRVPAETGVTYHNLSIEHRPYDQATLGPDIVAARYLADRYAEVAADGIKEIRQALDVIAVGEAPVVVHCSAGKDRTGLIIALVLALLGVSEDDIVADFALTGLATERFLADYRADPDNPALRWPGYGQAPAEVMRLFLTQLAAGHGSVHGYATSRLGVDHELITALRSKLL